MTSKYILAIALTLSGLGWARNLTVCDSATTETNRRYIEIREANRPTVFIRALVQLGDTQGSSKLTGTFVQPQTNPNVDVEHSAELNILPNGNTAEGSFKKDNGNPVDFRLRQTFHTQITRPRGSVLSSYCGDVQL